MDENSAVSSSAGPARAKPAAAQLDIAEPGTARAARRLLLGLFCGSSVVVLDFFIVLVCLPSISQSLHASSAHLQLVVAIYAVGSGSFLILGGHLVDVFGRRRVFSVGVVIFALASLACGLAT